MINTPEMRFQVDESRKFAVVDEVLARLKHRRRRGQRHRWRARQHAGWLVAAARLEHAGCAGRPRRSEGRGGLERLMAQIDGQLAESGIARGPQAGH
jgi:phosphomannomutase